MTSIVQENWEIIESLTEKTWGPGWVVFVCNSHTSVVWTLCSVPLLSILRRSGCDTDTIIMWTFGSVPLLSFLRKIDCILSFLNWQPNARRGNDYSYARMDGPHINGGIPHGDTVPTHLTNGYAENMMTNVSVFYTWYSLFLFCACTVCTWKSANNRCNTYKPWITIWLKEIHESKRDM